ncbi:MAG: CsbD family protein [Chloroflexota bacterium]
MNNSIWNQLEGNWKQLVGNAKERWGEFTEDELIELSGNRDKLIGEIQERYGIAQEEATEQVDEWANNLKMRINQ